jgi:hypothetical protein
LLPEVHDLTHTLTASLTGIRMLSRFHHFHSVGIPWMVCLRMRQGHDDFSNWYPLHQAVASHLSAWYLLISTVKLALRSNHSP